MSPFDFQKRVACKGKLQGNANNFRRKNHSPQTEACVTCSCSRAIYYTHFEGHWSNNGQVSQFTLKVRFGWPALVTRQRLLLAFGKYGPKFQPQNGSCLEHH
jgi:hypothetical protein